MDKPNNRANWMLMHAVRDHQKDGIKRALEQGADINYKVSKYEVSEPLSHAIHANDLEIVKLLISLGAKVDRGHAYSAISKNNPEMFDLLYQSSANMRAGTDEMLSFVSHASYGDHKHSIIAYLLEHGGNRDKCDRKYQSGSMDLTSDLVDKYTYKNLEELTEKYKDKGSKQAVRSLVYQAAAIAATLKLQSWEIAPFVAQCMECNLKRAEKLFSPEEYLMTSHPLDRVAERVGFDGYLKLKGSRIGDMLNEFVDTVVLPQFLIDAKMERDHESLAHEQSMGLHFLCEWLRPIAARLMLGEARLDEIIAMSESWHHGNHVPDALRPLRRNKEEDDKITWQALMPDVTYPGKGAKSQLVIHALTSLPELQQEGDKLDHCVGRNRYDVDCMRGDIHILSIRDNGKPIATAEIKLTGDPKHRLQLVQLEGYRNHEIRAEAKQAWEWFEKQINSGRIALNTPVRDRWGTLRAYSFHYDKPTLSPVLRQIGYDPDSKTVQACLDHYHTHLLVKNPTWKRQRNETSLALSSRYEQGYSWVDLVSKSDIHERIKRSGFQEKWDEQLKYNMPLKREPEPEPPDEPAPRRRRRNNPPALAR